MFDIQQTHIGQFKAFKLINTSNGSYAEILAGFGAGLNDLVIETSNGQKRSVINGYRSGQEVETFHTRAYRGSKLSPFPNRIYHGSYQFEGVSYIVPINEHGANNSLHGFLHDLDFSLKEAVVKDDFCKLILTCEYRDLLNGYPFPYDIEVRYQLDAKGLQVDTMVTNVGESKIPIGDGWHPYFSFPEIDKVKLKMAGSSRVMSLRDNALGSTDEFQDGKLIGSTSLDDCFQLPLDVEVFEVELTDESTGVDLFIWQEVIGYGYLQLFIPDTRDCIAVEPVSCPPDAFNSGQGLSILEPEKSLVFKMGIGF